MAEVGTPGTHGVLFRSRLQRSGPARSSALVFRAAREATGLPSLCYRLDVALYLMESPLIHTLDEGPFLERSKGVETQETSTLLSGASDSSFSTVALKQVK